MQASKPLAAICCTLVLAVSLSAQEPLNPFAPRPAVPASARTGVIQLSDGTALCGPIWLTPGKRWRFYDEKLRRYLELPLRVVERVEVEVVKEWLEKEWRFREAASNEKVYTGRKYPVRLLRFKVTLSNGRTLVGTGSTVFYVRDRKTAKHARKLILRQRQKGKPGQALKSLIYVRSIDFRPDAIQRYRNRIRSDAPDARK